MKITLENTNIAKVYRLVEQIKVKGKDALALAKFIKLLKQTLKSAGEDEQALVAQYALKDENGESKTDSNGNVQLDPALAREYNKVHGEWLEQEAEIEGGTYVNHIDDVQRIISDYVDENEIGGSDLDAYLALYEAFEKGEK
ncbi:DUF1617 family protein [Lacticaseibacillus paracasei]|uniref:DUF1617 family protein n=1 Tax=Lactobacillaceae TaxID=33958 RepID=UPI00237F050E|nr:DUF1617 family protein [Lacticaseibacillus paracasei]MDE3304023.1 DUF1617 family protein [Lacticaseibacillus paracasei]